MTILQKNILKSVGFSLPLMGLASWAKAYFLVPVILIGFFLFFHLHDKKLTKHYTSKVSLKMKKALIVARTLLVGIGIGAYVVAFIVDIDTFISPTDGKTSVCLINKLKYGAVIDKNHRTFALDHIRRGNTAVISVGDTIKTSLRIVAVPNDTVEIVNGCALVNGLSTYESKSATARFGVSRATPLFIVHKLQRYTNELLDTAFRTTAKIDPVCTLPVKEVYEQWKDYTYSVLRKNSKDSRVFPQSLTNNNGLQMHPMHLPSKGETITFTSENRDYLVRLIENYENESIIVRQSTVYIDDEPAKEYTFLYNYYFVLNDNRSILADSRLWGPIPEYEIIGSALTFSI